MLKNMNIAFGINNIDNYYIHTLTAINSILKNTNHKINIHIIHDSTLNKKEQYYFNILSKNYDQNIYFYNIDKYIKNIPNLENIKRFSKGCLYRLFLPRLLKNENVIYFDSDIIATIDISKLYNKYINNDKPLIAIRDTAPFHREEFKKYINLIFDDYKDYFNSGVLIFNNKLINNMTRDLPKEVIKILSSNYNLQFPDQDALNIIFGITNNVGYLSGKFNFQLENSNRLNYNVDMLNEKIIHYSWHKPWKMIFPSSLPYWNNREEINLIINKKSI